MLQDKDGKLDELHRWLVQPPEYKTYSSFKKAFRAECAPYVTKDDS